MKTLRGGEHGLVVSVILRKDASVALVYLRGGTTFATHLHFSQIIVVNPIETGIVLRRESRIN